MEIEIEGKLINMMFNKYEADFYSRTYHMAAPITSDAEINGIRITKKDFKRFKTMIDVIDAKITIDNAFGNKTVIEEGSGLQKLNRLDEVE